MNPSATTQSKETGWDLEQSTVNQSQTPPLKEAIGPGHPLWQDIAPDDSFSASGIYWADLPRGERWTWVNKQNNAEAARELSVIGKMFKEDPLSPIRAYFARYVIAGFGLLTEGYTLFSIGNLQSLFQNVWPTCWSTYKVCSQNWIAAVSYLQVCIFEHRLSPSSLDD